MAELLKLKKDVPERIALAFQRGKIVESSIPGTPNQVMFTLVDGRRTFLPLIAADRIREAGIAERVPFEITKLGPADYRVCKVQADFTDDRKGRETGATSWQRTPESPRGSTEAHQQPHATTSAVAIQQPGAATVATPKRGGMSKMLAGALIASIDAYVIAAEYGRSKGIHVELNLDFNAEDIRCSANSMLMEYWKKSGGAR